MLLYVQIEFKQYKLDSKECSVLDRTSSLSKMNALRRVFCAVQHKSVDVQRCTQLEKCWLNKLLHQENINASTKMYA